MSAVGRLSSCALVKNILRYPTLRCKSPQNVLEKINFLKNEGPKELVVMADFDHTISRSVDEKGYKCWTTHNVFNTYTNQQLGQKLHDLREKYIPIEFDPKLTTEQKIPHMIDWWQQCHSLIKSARVHRQCINEYTLNSHMQLRDKAHDWFHHLQEAEIPLVIFSAGLGDVIQVFLDREIDKDCKSNVHLVANMIQFDDEGYVREFKPPLVHTFNKSKEILSECIDLTPISGRHNVILMGDTIGDSVMHESCGAHNKHTVFKIAFLNLMVGELLDQYLDHFDVVLVEDQSMHIPLTITQHIQGNL